MGKLIFITGGARSGKSHFAESLCGDRDNVCYIATAIACDDEMRDRIVRHQSQRNPLWKTVEQFRDFHTLNDQIGSSEVVLLECITTMVTNLMFENPATNWDSISPEDASIIESTIIHEIDTLLRWAESLSGTTIIVSNETGMGIVPATPLNRWFRDFSGRANQKIASAADEVYLAVSGIPVKIK